MNEQLKAMLTSTAKAAGYKFDSTNPSEICIPYKGYNNWYEWNPAEDDAQCLQLARLLGITLCYTDNCAYKRLPDGTLFQEFWSQEVFDACWHNDREAVLAVAAQIGGMTL
jgi:hypothetical protein